MDFSTIVCTYIYGSFQVMVAALEAYQKIAKGTLERLESLAQAAITFYEFTVQKAVETIINLVKIYEKKLVDMIYSPDKDSIWCNRLWDCLTFVNELLDPNSLLFKKLNDWFSKQCTNFVNADLLNNIRGLLSDFQTFQQTICAYGFSFEFGISMIKEILLQYQKMLTKFDKTLSKKIAQLKKFLMQYLDWTIDTGVIDYLEKVEGLFNCIIDSSETCSSIATASNFYSNTCAKMHLQKNGDSWDVETDYKNGIYGNLEGSTIEINNAKREIEDICNSIANPKEVSRANKAYNLSKNIFPGGISWGDVTKEDGSFSWGKLWSKETWRKNAIYKKFNQSKDSLIDAWNREGERDPITTEKLMDGTEIDEYGNIYVRDGCNLVPIYPDPIEEVVTEYYSVEDGSNEVLMDGDEIISVTQAAVKIANEPDSPLAKRCEAIWRKLNDWSQNDDTAKRFSNVHI